MIESMNELMLESTQNVVVAANFILVNANVVITIDNTSWISLHLYVFQGWKSTFGLSREGGCVGDN
jgi:hypothetical protein